MNHQRIVGKRYQLSKELGKNDWKAFHLAIDTTMPGDFLCIVEEFKLEGGILAPEEIRTCFNNETYLWQQLEKREQLPPILACFDESTSLYLVRELIPGSNLAEWRQKHHRLSEDRLHQLLKDVLSSLKLIHELGFVHLNLKPTNIILSDRDRQAYLIDFSRAEAVKQRSAEDQSTAFFYSSNEYYPTAKPIAQVTPLQDIYALGAIAVEAITGKKLEQIPTDLPLEQFLKRECGQLTPQLVAVIERMLKFDVPEGYSTVSEVIADLDLIQVDPPTIVQTNNLQKTQAKDSVETETAPLKTRLPKTPTNTFNTLEKTTEDKSDKRPKRFKPIYLWGGILSLLVLASIGEFVYPVLRPRHHCDLGNKTLIDDPKSSSQRVFRQQTT